ncbi:MAG TPA: hypothetical protein O0X50_02460, partial [Methanocorpusculum sp.]|nr:hypothetical protein [Methanocorpusculum sp.]
MNNVPYISDEESPVSGFLQYYDCERTVDNYLRAIQQYLLIIWNTDLAYDLQSLDRVACDYLAELKNGRSVISDLMCVGN